MKRGFTLIELLVVVLIIGILSAVALPQYQVAVEKAKAAEAINTLEAVRRGIESYALAQGGIPEGGVHFMGPNSAVLDVDVLSSLTCDMYLCASKNFTYSASCEGPNLCLIRAYRGTPDEVYGSDEKYGIDIGFGFDTDGEVVRVCNGNSALGNKLCRSLSGWTNN